MTRKFPPPFLISIFIPCECSLDRTVFIMEEHDRSGIADDVRKHTLVSSPLRIQGVKQPGKMCHRGNSNADATLLAKNALEFVHGKQFLALEFSNVCAKMFQKVL